MKNKSKRKAKLLKSLLIILLLLLCGIVCLLFYLTNRIFTWIEVIYSCIIFWIICVHPLFMCLNYALDDYDGDLRCLDEEDE